MGSGYSGALTGTVMSEYLNLWDLLSAVALQPEVDDSHIWQFSTSGHTLRNLHTRGIHWGHAVWSMGENLGKLGTR
jgi:hypothetical protein